MIDGNEYYCWFQTWIQFFVTWIQVRITIDCSNKRLETVRLVCVFKKMGDNSVTFCKD